MLGSLMMSTSLIVGTTKATAQRNGTSSSATHASTLKEAQRLVSSHDEKSAAALLKSYLEQHPDDPQVLTLFGTVSLDLGDKESASQAFSRVLAKDPTSVPLNLLLGDSLLGARRFPEAMDRFETVLGLQPTDTHAQDSEYSAATQLALEAQQAGNLDAAVKVLEHAQKKSPADPQLLFALGDAALAAGQLAVSEEALLAAQKLAPGNMDVLYALARVEVEEQHVKQAEAHLRAYLAARPRDASAHYGLGHVLEMEQRDDEARAQFERAVQLQPVQTESYYQLGVLDLKAGRASDAESLFARVVARNPDHGGSLVGLGEISLQRKNYARAEEYLRHAVKAAPDYGPAHYYLGLTLARLGKKQEADDELKRATELGEAAAAPVQTGQRPPSPQ